MNKSTLLVYNDSKKASKPIKSPQLVPGPCIQQNSLFVAAGSAFLDTEQAAHANFSDFLLFPRQKCGKKEELMLISRLHGDMLAIRSNKSVPGAHLIGGESRPASPSLSTRTKFGDQQYCGKVWTRTRTFTPTFRWGARDGTGRISGIFIRNTCAPNVRIDAACDRIKPYSPSSCTVLEQVVGIG